MEKRLAFRTGRALVVVRLLTFALLALLIALALTLFPPVAPEYLILIGVTFAAGFVLFCLSLFFTEHWLTRSRLILRQGWYFRAVIPFGEIDSVRAGEELGRHRIPLGVHRPLGRAALYVTGGRTGLVEVRLLRPRRFLQAFGLLASEIVFDVTDPRGFLSAFEERHRLFAPVQADRADA